MRRGSVIAMFSISWNSQQIKSARYPTHTMLTIVPSPMQRRTVKKMTTRITAFIMSCHVPKDIWMNPLIPRFMQVKASTPNALNRKLPTQIPIKRMPVSIMANRLVKVFCSEFI